MNDLLFEKIYNSIKNHPDEWEPDDRADVYTHNKTGLAIWRWDGACEIWSPVRLKCFSFWQRHKLKGLMKKNLKGHKTRVFLKNMKIVEDLINKL
ncbi:MAG TPA: hypothetical protein VF941_03035 [Clostridia bacterium]